MPWNFEAAAKATRRRGGKRGKAHTSATHAGHWRVVRLGRAWRARACSGALHGHQHADTVSQLLTERALRGGRGGRTADSCRAASPHLAVVPRSHAYLREKVGAQVTLLLRGRLTTHSTGRGEGGAQAARVRSTTPAEEPRQTQPLREEPKTAAVTRPASKRAASAACLAPNALERATCGND